MACLEAICGGLLPVIADSPRSATRYFALTQKNLFTYDSPQSLAETMDYWLENAEEKQRCLENYPEISPAALPWNGMYEADGANVFPRRIEPKGKRKRRGKAKRTKRKRLSLQRNQTIRGRLPLRNRPLILPITYFFGTFSIHSHSEAFQQNFFKSLHTLDAFLSRSPSALSFSESAFPFSPFTDAYAARIRFASRPLFRDTPSRALHTPPPVRRRRSERAYRSAPRRLFKIVFER